MCTVTVIPFQGGLRLAINRDELRTRPPALSPRILELEAGIRAAWPIDPLAGGTWVAMNDRGLVLAILNGNPSPPPSLPPEYRRASRGLIIPPLAGEPSAEAAIDRLLSADLARFAPFRLVAADSSGIIDAAWDCERLETLRGALAPACFVSSGLGDARAAPRLELFRGWFSRRAVDPRAQDEFHRHRWPDRPEMSVRMERADARTVSVTTVESSPMSGCVLHHEDDSGPSRVALPATRFAACRTPC